MYVNNLGKNIDVNLQVHMHLNRLHGQYNIDIMFIIQLSTILTHIYTACLFLPIVSNGYVKHYIHRNTNHGVRSLLRKSHSGMVNTKVTI